MHICMLRRASSKVSNACLGRFPVSSCVFFCHFVSSFSVGTSKKHFAALNFSFLAARAGFLVTVSLRTLHTMRTLGDTFEELSEGSSQI